MPAIITFFKTKLIPAFNAIIALLPSLLGTTEGDVNAVIAAVTKILTDLSADWNAVVSAVKSST
jgi:hypothetical protein